MIGPGSDENAIEDAQGQGVRQGSPFWRLTQKHILKNRIQNNQYKHGSPVALRGCRGDV